MSTLPARNTQAVIVGAGPVGLFLGCCLHHFGLPFVIFERRKDRRGQSRAIGIHPPSLELFDRLGLADALVARGIRVKTGRAFSGERELGHVSFEECPPPFHYVLTVPQQETENLMEEHLNRVAPGSIFRDSPVGDFTFKDGKVLVRARLPGGVESEVSAQFLIGCDGPRSVVREKSGIGFEGGAYDDTFVMGDFHDRTSIGDEARVYLDDDGFIESFPLPGRTRRWVLQTKILATHPNEDGFCREIRERTGADLVGCLSSLLSAFSVHHYIAQTFVKGRILLAGDAAHVMSPIGGQGMNVGWMDALDIAGALHHAVEAKIPAEHVLDRYNETARARAKKAIERAELYMAIGRRGRGSWLKRAGVGLALRMPGRNLAAQFFTMRGL